MFIVVPTVLALTYWAAHDPRSIKMLEHWHLYQAKRLNAWGKAQASRQKVYERAMAKVAPTRRPQLTEVVEG
jgi:hypothetical protein